MIRIILLICNSLLLLKKNNPIKMSELKEKIKAQLIEQLNLEDMSPSDIDDDMPLFGEGLGLDSIDALEIVVLLDTEYNLKLENHEVGKQIFHSINTLADFIEKNS